MHVAISGYPDEELGSISYLPGRTFLVRISKYPLHKYAVQPNPNAVLSEPMIINTCT